MKIDPTKALSIKRNILWNTIGCAFYLGCQWLITVLVVLLSPSYANSGILAFAMAIGTIYGSIALYKVRTFQVSDIKREYSDREYIAFRLLTIIVSLMLCFVYLAVVSAEGSYIVPTLIYILFKADEAFSDVLYGIEQLNERMDYIGKSQIIRGFVSLGSFSAALYCSQDLGLAIGVMAFSCFAVTLVYDIPHARLFGPVSPRISLSSAKGILKTCSFGMVSTLCANAIVSCVRQYYGLSYGEDALGLYAAVATPAILVQVAALYFYSPMIGLLAKELLTKGSMLFLKLFVRIIVLIAIVVAVIIIALGFFGPSLLTMVYGESMVQYIDIFPSVLAATAFIAILFYINDVLIVLRFRALMLVFNSLALLIALFSAVPLISCFGMSGINISIILGTFSGVVMGLVAVVSHCLKMRRA